MAERRYTEDHEWVEADGNVGTIGISEYAQEQLGDVVFVELPDSGKILDKGDAIAVVESVQAAAEVYAPVGGGVVEVNEEMGADPSLVHTDAFADGGFLPHQTPNPVGLAAIVAEAAS